MNGFKHYLVSENGKAFLVFAKSIKDVRNIFTSATVVYMGQISKNELFFGTRLFGEKLGENVYKDIMS